MAHSIDISGRQHFNQWSKSYEHSLMQWLLFDRVHRGVMARIPDDFIPDAVLDIGCGTGRLLRRMAARWPEAHLSGVDLAEGMVAQAHRLTPGATIYQAPAEHLPLGEASVNLVTSTTSFHHWNDRPQGVREAARVLRPGGWFILADMSLPIHSQPISRLQVCNMFREANLVIRSQTGPLPFFTFTIGVKP